MNSARESHDTYIFFINHRIISGPLRAILKRIRQFVQPKESRARHSRYGERMKKRRACAETMMTSTDQGQKGISKSSGRIRRVMMAFYHLDYFLLLDF